MDITRGFNLLNRFGNTLSKSSNDQWLSVVGGLLTDVEVECPLIQALTELLEAECQSDTVN